MGHLKKAASKNREELYKSCSFIFCHPLYTLHKCVHVTTCGISRLKE